MKARCIRHADNTIEYPETTAARRKRDGFCVRCAALSFTDWFKRWAAYHFGDF